MLNICLKPFPICLKQFPCFYSTQCNGNDCKTVALYFLTNYSRKKKKHRFNSLPGTSDSQFLKHMVCLCIYVCVRRSGYYK